MLLLQTLAVVCLVAYAYGMTSVKLEPSQYSSRMCCPCKSGFPESSKGPRASRAPRKPYPEGEPEKEPKSEGEPPEAWYGMLGGLLGVFVIATVVLAVLLVKTKKQVKTGASYPAGFRNSVQADELPPKYVAS